MYTYRPIRWKEKRNNVKKYWNLPECWFTRPSWSLTADCRKQIFPKMRHCSCARTMVALTHSRRLRLHLHERGFSYRYGFTISKPPRNRCGLEMFRRNRFRIVYVMAMSSQTKGIWVRKNLPFCSYAPVIWNPRNPPFGPWREIAGTFTSHTLPLGSPVCGEFAGGHGLRILNRVICWPLKDQSAYFMAANSVL